MDIGGDIADVYGTAMVTLTNTKTKVSRTFKTARAAGKFLERSGWPKGLLYAPEEDRVALAVVMAGSPWDVKEIDEK